MIVTTLTTINKATVQAKENSKNSSETILHIYNINEFKYIVEDNFTASYGMRIQILDYLDGNSSYGFYIDCHGSSNWLGDNKNWSIYPSDIHGNFHLVFLDACSTAADHTWANAFNCDQSGRGFLGWRTSVQAQSVYEFCQYFWTHVGDKSICNVAIDAAASVPGAGTTPIVYIGDRSWYGYAY